MPDFTAYPDLGAWTAYADGAPLSATGARPDPARLWLQVGADACSEMYVIWQEPAGDFTDASIEYREEGGSWQAATGAAADHPYTGEGYSYALRKITRVHLTGLQPETVYEFRFSEDGEVFTFRTFPDTLAGGRSVRLVSAGDSYAPSANTATIAARMAGEDPDAVVHGGDWAYADGLPSNLYLWDDLWDALCPALRVGNRIIPFVPCIGNHEVTGTYGSKEDAPYFYAYFVLPHDDGAYHEVQAGDWLRLTVIDTEYTSGILTGATTQEAWLAGVLAAGSALTGAHRIAVMHAPPWPFVRSPGATVETRLRAHLPPLLEAAGVRTALVHHDHCFGRTLRVRTDSADPGNADAGAESEAGVVYLGNGAWGKLSSPGARWYAAASSNTPHYWTLTLTETLLSATAKNGSGVVLDTFEDAVGAPGTASGAPLGLVSAPLLEAPSATQAHAGAPEALTSPPALETPAGAAASGAATGAPLGLTSAPLMTRPAVSLVYSVTPEGLLSTPVLEPVETRRPLTSLPAGRTYRVPAESRTLIA